MFTRRIFARFSLAGVAVFSGVSYLHPVSGHPPERPRSFTKPKFPSQVNPYSRPGDCKRVMSLDEINEMVDHGRIVVTFKGCVYDVTDFSGHPGGYGRLMMVAGQDLDAFWRVYTQHNRGHILELLQRYKIGELTQADAETQQKNSHFNNPYVNDPPPMPELLTNTRYPYNAEARLRDLTDSYITPIGRHFVRNHGLVPDIDETKWDLAVVGHGIKETHLTLQDLKTKFPRTEVTTVIQCNGNRREDYHYLNENEPSFGPPHWVAGAMGCSTWAGAKLRDVLREAGMDVDGISLGKVAAPRGATNISFRGSDTDEVGNQYCCSIPFEKAIDPFGDCLIAYEMNGEPIPRLHGFPARAIVPGHAGARHCKFLERVTVTHNPCLDASNWKQYAVHAPDVSICKLAEFELNAPELKQDPVVQEMPVQSLITSPGAGDVLAVTAAGGDTSMIPSVSIRGLAWGGGGTDVNRVDVSLDGGKTFTRADLLKPEVDQRRGSNWAWVFFEKELTLPAELRTRLQKGETVELELCSKALNSSWNVQPERAEPNRNPHGCCVNHWYRVPVTLDPHAPVDRLADDGDFANKPSGGKFKRPFTNMKLP